MGKMKEKNHIMSKWFIKIHKNKKQIFRGILHSG